MDRPDHCHRSCGRWRDLETAAGISVSTNGIL